MKAIDYEKESDNRSNWLDITGGTAKDSLTLLDYFAGKAMAALIASPRLPANLNDDGEVTDGCIAELAYHVAEAMLAERNKRFTPTNAVRGITGKTYG